MKEKKRKVDPAFDGHLEKDLTRMSAKEKLLYLSEQIELRHFIKKNVRKVSSQDKEG